MPQSSINSVLPLPPTLSFHFHQPCPSSSTNTVLPLPPTLSFLFHQPCPSSFNNPNISLQPVVSSAFQKFCLQSCHRPAHTLPFPNHPPSFPTYSHPIFPIFTTVLTILRALPIFPSRQPASPDPTRSPNTLHVPSHSTPRLTCRHTPSSFPVFYLPPPADIFHLPSLPCTLSPSTVVPC
ncbi:hypothetical protein Pmani_025577 [Petrolisthes manimaculis]|uniref:Uncharacterized protein n=1 Tax=Petrolisthes manimaculis TaxID=1843537 RepID=A0AAE1TYA1_9EUCA|nr:hypothetical protein Pmani_025577 [Petrolisthes manimaculis]